MDNNAPAPQPSSAEEIDIVMNEAERPKSPESAIETTLQDNSKQAATASSDSSGGDDSAKENKDGNKAKKKGRAAVYMLSPTGSSDVALLGRAIRSC